MHRFQLELLLQEAAKVAGESEFILVGSQAVHAHTDLAPMEVLVSRECDIWAKSREEKLTVVEAALGRTSRFAEEYGFYVASVDPALVLLPVGWEARLKRMNFGPVTVWCLDVNDLVVSKLNAGRIKDYEFADEGLRRDRLRLVSGVLQRIKMDVRRDYEFRLRSDGAVGENDGHAAERARMAARASRIISGRRSSRPCSRNVSNSASTSDTS